MVFDHLVLGSMDTLQKYSLLCILKNHTRRANNEHQRKILTYFYVLINIRNDQELRISDVMNFDISSNLASLESSLFIHLNKSISIDLKINMHFILGASFFYQVMQFKWQSTQKVYLSSQT